MEAEAGGRGSTCFSPAEEELFHLIARSSNSNNNSSNSDSNSNGEGVYGRIARSVAPAVAGEYTKDIKRALACQLFGGSRKVSDVAVVAVVVVVLRCIVLHCVVLYCVAMCCFMLLLFYVVVVAVAVAVAAAVVA